MKKIGVVGYSDDKVFDKDIAKALLVLALDIVESDMANNKDNDFYLVSGLTNMGIPKLAYEEAEKRGWKTIGITAAEGKKYDCFKVSEEIIVGEKFGDESEKFIDYIDCLVRVGGGKQSMKETEMAKKANKQVYEYDLPEKVK
jgi:hypothetical protein